MGALTKAKPQAGAMYVEAAIIMPVLLLVTFASLFFLLVAARHFSLQMLANEIAKDVSLSLQPTLSPSISHSKFECIPNCMKSDAGTNLRDFSTPQPHTVNLQTYSYYQTGSTSGCWNSCAADKYLLAAPGRQLPYALSVTITAHPRMQIFDEDLPPSGGLAAAGDLFEVSVAYPLRAVWGGGIAFFGLIPATSKIYANAVGVIDKRENP